MYFMASSDPIGLAGGINTYAYVGGRPTMQTDPKGLMESGGGGSAAHPNPAACPPEKCKDVIVVYHKGICDGNPDPMCAAGMQAAGLQGPYFSYARKYDVPCLVSTGLFKGGGMVGGAAVQEIAPSWMGRILAITGSTLGNAASVLMAVDFLFKHCECATEGGR